MTGRAMTGRATTGRALTGRSTVTNLQTYDAPEVAAHYAALDYLTPCERVLFETYVRSGSAILDLGVGGGRTTAYLANRASRDVGVDYAPAMVNFAPGFCVNAEILFELQCDQPGPRRSIAH